MNSKNNPGKYDCYAEAAEDEPLFVLRANDPIAPFLVRIWASIRARNLNLATEEVKRAFNKIEELNKYTDGEKILEAHLCSLDMEAWLIQKNALG